MGSLKPSVRSRGGVFPPESVVVKGNGHGRGEPDGRGMKPFTTSSFDSDGYLQSRCPTMDEEGLQSLCSELLGLKKASAEELRRSVYANYAAFIRTSREISDLEGELQAMRSLLSTQASLIHGLAEGVQVSAEGTDIAIPEDEHCGGFGEDYIPSELEKRALAIPDLLDILIAERRVEEALLSLEEGERIATDGAYKELMSSAALGALQEAILEGRVRLAELVAETASHRFVRGSELRAAIAALDRLGDGSRAHTLLLSSHRDHLRYRIQELHPSASSYHGAYTVALSSLVFSAIAHAAKDSRLVFGERSPHASELLLWASDEIEAFAGLLKTHVLSSAAAAGGLRAAAECVDVALAHASVLEGQGLTLASVLVRLLRPSVHKALEANLKRIEDSVFTLAAVDAWTPPPASRSLAIGPPANPTKLSSSAQRFQLMVQDLFEDVSPLVRMQLAAPLLDGLFHVFDAYVTLLIRAIGGFEEDEGWVDGRSVRPAETATQQLCIVGNVLVLAEDLLPRAAMKLYPSPSGRDEPKRRGASGGAGRMPELKEWRRRLHRSLERLRSHFCQQQILDLLYTEDGAANLNADSYLRIDGDDVHSSSEPMPSPVFQELFAKLNRLAQAATEILLGKERAVSVIMAKVTETFVLWLLNDDTFWELLEDGPNPLGALGLQQFMLDMHFIIHIAYHGRYYSRHMQQVVDEITNKALEAFNRTGLDSSSVLPDYDWFSARVEEATHKLLSKGGGAEVESPTHSMSAYSATSHGSP